MPQTPDSVFQAAAEIGASDIHIAAGSPILFRIDGVLEPKTEQALSDTGVAQFIKKIIGEKAFKKLQEEKEVDIAYALSDGTRFRVNCHVQKGNPGMVARLIPSEIPTLEDVGLDKDVIHELCALQDGLILFTGPTGSGKSTSMAAMIQHIAEERPAHIITLEDPIEFLFESETALIRQREFGQDFLSFPEALKRVLRQDPNIVMVGEMRDLETVAAALTLAETGHLIFATLHTPNVVQTIDRIVDIFPPHQQNQVRTQLSMSLKAVIAQRLIPREGGGRIAQREILLNTPAVANIIRESRAQELKSVVQTNKDKGMCTFESSAKELLKEGEITEETCEWAKKGV